MPTVLQFGAGSIGRGFTGQLFVDAGLEVVFVDVAEVVVAALNERRSYPIRFVGPRIRETRTVRGVRAVNGRDEEAVAEHLAGAALACTAVGAAALPRLAPVLARGLQCRARRGAPPLNVILCENQLGVSERLREAVRAVLPLEQQGLADHTGFVESVVSRMVPAPDAAELAADPLALRCEDYARLPVDADALVATLPAVPGLEPCRPFPAYFERKLYCHNLGHAVAAYQGHLRGHLFLHDAVADEDVLATTRGAMEEAGAALVARHGFEPREQRAHAEDLLVRFANPELRDTVVRVGRDPLRKLRREDRLVGAALLAVEHGVTPHQIARGIAAALRFENPHDPSACELHRRLAGEGIDAVLRDVCGLAPEETLTRLVRDVYEVPSL
jgi:mannitol-1-phosphate 5-dehydrogenase